MTAPTAAEPRDVNEIADYHAHVYYDPSSRDRAAMLRDWIAVRFPVVLGRWHEGKVGPHPQAMYQIGFAPSVFPALVPWLMLNRLGLTVLVHPNTGNELDDHLLHGIWLGETLPLDASALQPGPGRA
jgi:DOPA 4,5-dioxygenase